jgi:predicted ATPase/class 3 adenylate cyclase
MGELPSGTVTFLFTDLEGSSRLWEAYPDAMGVALGRHDGLLRDAVEAHGGYVVKFTGDGVHAAFRTAEAAVAAAVDAQRRLTDAAWAETGPLRVRMGVHTGAAEVREGDYYGSAVNRAARIADAAHGGQIIVSHVTEELIGESLPDGLELVDLGEHRLRDLSRADRVFQVHAPGLGRDFPALRSIDAFPGNLPLQLTSFVGREDEFRTIAKAFDSTRLVTLTGVGGVGKTRLALQAAAEMIPRFADGAWFCELAAASDADAMTQVVASALGVNPRPGATLEGSIVEFLGTKRLLLVLDNCEHLLAAVGRLVEAVLRGAPGVSVLVTSREGLSVEGERNLTLRSLATPDAADGLTAIETSASVRLFVERAVDAHSDFVVTESSLAGIAEICRRLDGIPLAIELAAARTTAMSPREIAARLDERFRLLTGGRRTAVERHQTLRATVDWSYSLLGEREQTVFERLGVFAGSFDASAAEAIVSGEGIEPWDVLDALSDLAAKSMVVVERTEDTTRYQLNETMRAYALERLDDAEAADTWRRLYAVFYADFAEAAGPGMVSADEFVWRPRIRLELDNVRAAVAWSLDRTDTSDNLYAIRIIAALAYLVNQDRPSGLGTWAERSVDLAETTEPTYRAPILAAAAESLRGQGEMDRARTLAAAALRDGIPSDSPQTMLAYVVLTVADATRGDIALSYRETQDGIAQARAATGRDSFATAGLEAVAAIWATTMGNAVAAQTHVENSLSAARRVGNPTILSAAHYTAGDAATRSDDPSAALAHYNETIALVRAGAADTVYVPALQASAVLLLRTGEETEALERVREATARAHHDADMSFLIGTITAAIVVLNTVGWQDPLPELAGIVTLGKYSHLYVMPVANLYGTPEVIDKLRTAIGEDAFDRRAERGAAMNADEIAAFLLASIDRAKHDLPRLTLGAHETG